jgi:outer membrane protein OmpA-like peptidoglycan-associated protein
MKNMMILVSLLSIALWACAGSKVEETGELKLLAEKTNQCPEITDVSVSETTVRGGEQVRIAVTASDPDQQQLFYFWSASAGDLTGREAQVVWTAPPCEKIGKPTETYEIAVDATDGDCAANRQITLTVDCGVSQTAESMILFPAGSAKLDNIAKAELDKIAALLKQFPDQTIVLEGHTDQAGNEDANKAMGLKRAESVKQYLVNRHGLDPNRITTTSYGSTKPVDTNDTKAGRAKNRRVEIYRKF